MDTYNEGPAEGVRRWLKTAAEDPLPEVRNLILDRDNFNARKNAALQVPPASPPAILSKSASDGGAIPAT